MSLPDGIRTCNPRKRALDRDSTGISRVVMYTADYPVRIPAGLLGLHTWFLWFLHNLSRQGLGFDLETSQDRSSKTCIHV